MASNCKTIRFLLGFLVVGLGATLLLSGCKQGRGKAPATLHTIKDVEVALKNKDFSVGPREEKIYQLLSASDGCALRVNGELVELYVFDTTIKSGREALQKLKEDGFMGQSFLFHDNIAYEAPEKISMIIKGL